MKILHLFSDWKWTGPAEPALMLATRLAARGHDVHFACSPAPLEVEDSLPARVAAAPVEMLEGLRLEKHFNLLGNLADARALAPWLREKSVDVVHVHRDQDHLVGGAAVRLAGTPTAVVRTNHTARPLRPLSPRHRLLVHRMTDGLVEVSRAALERDRAAFGLPADRVAFVEAAVALPRFAPGSAAPCREALGLAPTDTVVGIVARVQKRRRFDLLFEAFRAACRVRPDLRLLLVGRGTHFDAVARDPVERLGIGARVTLAGYRAGDYPSILASMDVMVFLVPGTDGSCRAVREGMASGLPVVATRRGILPELVVEGAGILVDETPASLSAAILRLAEDEVLRRRLGAGAYRAARERFDPEEQAERMEAVYAAALERARPRIARPGPAPVPAAPAPGGGLHTRERPEELGPDPAVGEWPETVPERPRAAPAVRAATPAPAVSVVIVNWNGRRLLKDCLDSVPGRGAAPDVEVFLVDNASTDGSVDFVGANWPAVKILRNAENRGFGAANNRAFHEARGDTVLLLNSDARLQPPTLGALEAFLDDHPRAGAVTPALVGADGRPQNAFDNFPTLATELLNKALLRLLFPRRFPGKRLKADGPFEVESALGACLLLRRAALEEAGHFDERFFFFLEETDLCRRLRARGWTIHVLPSATAVHLGGASKAFAPAESWIEYYRSLYRYFHKHETPARYWALRVGRFLKLLANTAGTFAVLYCSMGMNSRALRKFPVYARLLRWHLLGCPDGEGLRPRVSGRA